MKTTAGRRGSRGLPSISGRYSRAGTIAPSRARNATSLGSSQGKASHSAVAEVVTWVSGAPGRAAARKTSGGRFDVERTRPRVRSSGERTPVLEPATVVSRVRAPPSIGIVYSWRSPGWASVVVRRKAFLAGETSTAVTSHAPEVRARAAPPSTATVYRCIQPVRSEVKNTVRPSGRKPKLEAP